MYFAILSEDSAQSQVVFSHICVHLYEAYDDIVPYNISTKKDFPESGFKICMKPMSTRNVYLC